MCERESVSLCMFCLMACVSFNGRSMRECVCVCVCVCVCLFVSLKWFGEVAVAMAPVVKSGPPQEELIPESDSPLTVRAGQVTVSHARL